MVSFKQTSPSLHAFSVQLHPHGNFGIPDVACGHSHCDSQSLGRTGHVKCLVVYNLYINIISLATATGDQSLLDTISLDVCSSVK